MFYFITCLHTLDIEVEGEDMYYIKEIDKPSKFLKRCNWIKSENNEIILPIQGEEIKYKQAQKLSKKTKKILQKTNTNKIVLSKIIKKQKDYCNNLYSYGFDIPDGKWLLEILSCETLGYIVEKKNLKKQELMVSILVNQLSEITLQNIKQLVKEYKRINIVTNHIQQLKKLEDEILEEEGIMITVTNNKKKSLLKSNIILNIDFPTELINQYQIKEDAIILNIQGNVKIKKKRFCGICINDYEIKRVQGLEYEDIEEQFWNKDIYEACFYKRQPIVEIKKKVRKDNVQIAWLQGLRVII